jgi:hypothetical protein
MSLMLGIIPAKELGAVNEPYAGMGIIHAQG